MEYEVYFDIGVLRNTKYMHLFFWLQFSIKELWMTTYMFKLLWGWFLHVGSEAAAAASCEAFFYKYVSINAYFRHQSIFNDKIRHQCNITIYNILLYETSLHETGLYEFKIWKVSSLNHLLRGLLDILVGVAGAVVRVEVPFDLVDAVLQGEQPFA